MGQLRGSAASALQLGAGPAAATAALERRARLVDGAAGATVFMAVIDPAAGTIRYSNAGQVPAILVRPDWTVSGLDDARSPVLCALDEDLPRTEATVGFEPGSMLLVFTDGLVERPGEDLSRGYARLRRVLRQAPGHLDDYAAAILQVALDGHVRTDDVALVLVSHRRR